MEYLITREENTDELLHYGVLGMKWGVRRASKQLSSASDSAGRAKAKAKMNKHYEKASKKLDKLDSKIEKKQAKSEKAYAKYTKVASRSGLFRSESDIQEAKNNFKTKDAKVANQVAKANKWYQNMEKTFKDTPITMTSAQQAKGKRYVDTMKYRLERSGFDRRW